jgi:hypothetical protein
VIGVDARVPLIDEIRLQTLVATVVNPANLPDGL